MEPLTDMKRLSKPDDDGWMVLYTVRRKDGDEVAVEVSCTRTAEAAAQANNNDEALATMKNHGALEAVRLAEASQPPSRRGGVLIKMWFDPTDEGNACHDYIYQDNQGR